MTIAMTAVAGWVLAAGLAGEETMRFRTPEDAGLGDVALAAEQIGARCREYGYRGIRTRVVEDRGRRFVDVSCESGYTAEMHAMVRLFATIRGSSIEVRFPYERTTAEQEQYQSARDPSQDKTPPGARWYRWWDGKMPPVLLRDAPAVPRTSILLSRWKDRSGVEQVLCRISKTRTREIEKADLRKSLGQPILILDGLVLQPIGLTRRELDRDRGLIVNAERASFVLTGSGLKEILIHPLPFTLHFYIPEKPEPTPTQPGASAKGE